MRRLSSLAPLLVAVIVLVSACGGEQSVGRTASADGSTGGSVTRGVLVSMGDSYISGTGGRWRGNSNGATDLVRDPAALARTDTGEDAYDNYGFVVPGEECFRSRAAVIHLGEGWTSRNLACSNARTTSRRDEEGKYKPGIDEGGQLDELRTIASDGSVELVAVSIGANDLRFGPVIEACVIGYLTSLSSWPRLCSADPAMRMTIAPESLERARTAIVAALVRIVDTMREIGYSDDQWRLVSQTYPSPLPPSSAMRYPQSGLARQSTGGCPFYDADVDWLGEWMTALNATVLRAARDASAATGMPVLTLDMGGLFAGRRLCETGSRLVEETATDAELLALGERVAQINLSARFPGSPYRPSEGVHPGQLGQSAMRACLRRLVARGRSGECRAPTDWGVQDGRGEPSVVFVED